MALTTTRARRTALPLAGAAALALLAGCAGSPAGESSSTEGLELTVWNPIDFEPYQSLQEGYFEACAAEAGITVKVETISGDYTTSLLQAAGSKSLPDVAMMNTDSTLPELAAQGVLADLDTLGITTDGLAESVAALGEFDGTLYGLPVQVEDYALFYNVAAFEAAGITELPTTFDELAETAKAVTTEEQHGIALPGAGGDGSTASYLLPFLLSAGGDPSDVTSDASVAALELYQQLVSDGALSKEFVNWGWEGIDQWTSQSAAITVSGPWNLVDDTLDFEYDTIPFPTLEAGDEPTVGLLGYAYAVSAQVDEAHQQAAAELVKCRAAEENQIETALKGGYIPALTSAQEAFVAEVPAADSFVSAIANAYNAATLGTEWNALQQVYVDALQDATVNGTDAAEALSKVAKD